MTRTVRRLAVPIGVTVLVLGALVNMRHGPARYSWIDFQSFYGAGQDVRHGANPYSSALAFVHSYTPRGNGTLFATKSYVYAPIVAVLMIPFTWVPGYAALTAWDVLNVGFLVGTVYAALRIAGIRPRAGLTLLLAAAAAVTAPVQKEWALGQTDVFVMFMVCVSFWARRDGRHHLAGLALGLVCPIKPALSLLLVFLLWKREYRVAIVAASASAVLLVAPFIVLGSTIWSDQWTVWHFWSHEFLPFAHNDSPAGVLARLFTANPVTHPLIERPYLATVLWLSVVAAVVLCTAALVSRRSVGGGTTGLLELGLVLEAILLVTPLTEWPYLVLVVVPLVGLVAWLRQVGPWAPRTRLVVVAGIAVWLLLCGPAGIVEYRLDDHFRAIGWIGDLFVVLAPIYLYVLVGAFMLQARVLAELRGLTVRGAVRAAVAGAPRPGLRRAPASRAC